MVRCIRFVDYSLGDIEFMRFSSDSSHGTERTRQKFFVPGAGIAHALQANNQAALSYLQSNLFFQHARLALRHLAWLNLLWVIPMFARWRVVAVGRSRRNVRR